MNVEPSSYGEQQFVYNKSDTLIQRSSTNDIIMREFSVLTG